MNDDSLTPKTYLEREKLLPNAEFMLISYAHTSKGNVYPDLQALYDKGLNFWYDKELLTGDIWHQTILDRLSCDNCCGIIFFFDINCLINSDADPSNPTGRGAVEREVQLFEQVLKVKPNMRAFCVLNKEDASVYSIVREAFIRCRDMNDSRLKECLPEERVITILQSFSSDKIYIPKIGNYIEKIVEEVAKTNPLAVSNTKTAVDDFKSLFKGSSNDVNGCIEISYGSYPQKINGTAIGTLENEIRTTHNERFITSGKKQYAFAPIQWLLLETDGTEATLLCKSALDGAMGDGDSISKWLTLFSKTAFTEDEANAITEISLPSSKLIEKLGGMLSEITFTEYADRCCDADISRYVWLSDSAQDTRKILCDIYSGIPDIDFDYIDATHGMLPAIKIELDKLRR